jgi:hypothetical protein
MSLGPWTRGDVLDLHIFILLIIWMILDRSNIYFSDIWNFIKRLGRAIDQVLTLDFWRGR